MNLTVFLYYTGDSKSITSLFAHRILDEITIYVHYFILITLEHKEKTIFFCYCKFMKIKKT